MKKVYLVTGSPASGKSRYVQTHAGKNDLVFDLDKINEALGGTAHAENKHTLAVALAMRDAAVKAIGAQRGDWDNAWFITSSSSRAELARLQSQMKAERITMEASMQDCIKNAMRDDTRPDKDREVGIIRDWFDEMAAPKEPETTGERFAAFFREAFPDF